MRRPQRLALGLLGVVACSRAPAPTATAPAAAPAAQPPPAAADATSLRYAAGANRYRIETTQHTEQEMMGNTNAFDVNTTQHLSVTLAPAGDALGLTVVLDSVTMTTTAPGGEAAGQAAARAMTGKRFTGTMTPLGEITALSSPDSAVNEVAQAMTGIRQFFPELPAPPLTAGREWTDTTSSTQALEAFNLTTRSVRTHRIGGWEMREGARALRITTRAAYNISGTGDAQGQPLELAGTGRATTDRFVSAAGVYLGATELDSAEINVNVVSMGMTIPVRRSQRATITRLP